MARVPALCRRSLLPLCSSLAVPPGLCRVGRGRRRHAALPEARAPPPRCRRRGALLKELQGRQGPPRVPEDLLGAPRPDPGHRRPTSSRTTSARSGSTPTRSSRTRTRRAPRPAAGRCWPCSAARRRSSARATSAPAGRQVTGRGAGARPGPARAGSSTTWPTCARASTREPETWVYRDRPGLPYTFTGAELRIALRRRVPVRGGRASSTRTCAAPRRRSSRGPTSPTAAGATGTSCRSRRSGARRRAPSIS